MRKFVLTNDANAAAMGEMIFGAAKGMKDLWLLRLVPAEKWHCSKR